MTYKRFGVGKQYARGIRWDASVWPNGETIGLLGPDLKVKQTVRLYDRTVRYRVGAVGINVCTSPSVSCFRRNQLDNIERSYEVQILVPDWVSARLSLCIPFWSIKLTFGISV